MLHPCEKHVVKADAVEAEKEDDIYRLYFKKKSASFGDHLGTSTSKFVAAPNCSSADVTCDMTHVAVVGKIKNSIFASET